LSSGEVCKEHIFVLMCHQIHLRKIFPGEGGDVLAMPTLDMDALAIVEVEGFLA
jgi:hypothetical protein